MKPYHSIAAIFLLYNLLSQSRIFSNELPIGLTEEEKNNIHLIYEMGRDTEPPIAPVRNIAEYERMSGVLIRYPFGISLDIIRELSEGVTVYCLVSASQQNSAFNSISAANINMNNIQFIVGPTDSYWTRDYGPWWVVNGNGDVSVVDFTYDRPRPNDNDAPFKVSEFLDVPYYSVDIVHTGGNYMTDGYGISASSDLVYEENNWSNDALDSLMGLYYGVNTYHVLADPNNTYIDHIDCWGKYLSPTKVLIREVPASHPQYNEIESVATYFSESLNTWGFPWEVFRVWTPNDQPYTNSLIVNDKVLVPIMNDAWDDEALELYQTALAGYEVIGVTGTWESTDALHCRVKGIPDLEMLQLFHMPLRDTVSASNTLGYDLELVVDDLSGAGIIDDSVQVFWKNDNMQHYNVNSLYRSDILEEINTYRGSIPVQAFGTMINYFLRAADSSGRVESNPIAGHHSFYGVPTDACNSWELGDMNNSGQLEIYDILILADLIVNNNNFGVCCESVADINEDGVLSIIDIVTLVSLVASQ
tara:strand:- start:806 stop:2401 length:1596 start_codon:yes stop_codon:yes gene_type:complete